MTQQEIKKLNDLTKLLKEIEYIKYTLNGVLYWDKMTMMPKGGIYYRSEVMSYLAEELYKKFSSSKLHKLVEYFDQNFKNDEKIVAMIRKIKRNYVYVNKIPKAEYKEYINHIAISEAMWQEAREKNDFSIFAPYLNKSLEYFKKFAQYWGYEKNPYDALLQYYEDGIDVEMLERLIPKLKEVVLEIVKKRKKNFHKILYDDISNEDQEKISKELLELIGFNFNYGRLDVGEHPTTLSSSPRDVRIVTHLEKEDIFTGIYNTLHEGGKGLYEQDIDNTLIGTLLAEVSSFSLEEAESKIYENIIGKNRKFCFLLHEKLSKISSKIKESNVEEIYHYVNKITPSLIRINADEVTFILHIIIRYEIEKELIEEKIEVEDIVKVWNEKYKLYLGVVPNNFKEGILQDIHWAAGYFGYFPSYLLAGIYSAQIVAILNKKLSGIVENIDSENLKIIHQWLKENIHKYGSIYTPKELIRKICNEEVSSSYYIDYLKGKYIKS